VSVSDFGPAPRDWCWQSIDSDTASEQWRSLCSWVGWLRSRYPIADQLPACWWRHSELVEELTGLWLAWLAAYTEPQAPLTAPIDFHDRLLPSFLGRVRRWGIQCLDEHRPRPASVYGGTTVDDPDALADFIGDAPGARRPDPDRGGPQWLDRLPVTAVRCLVDEGYARPMGDLDRSAVLIHHDYWLPTGRLFVRVRDGALHRQLAREDHRQMLAAAGQDDPRDLQPGSAADEDDGPPG
jgi:hypothetical protein